MSKSHPDLNEDYFNTIDTNEKAYWLGFIYADGYVVVRNNHKRLGIAIDIKDKDHLDLFIEHIKGNKEKKFQVRNKPKFIYFEVTSQKIVNDLIKYGCVPKKSNIIQLPSISNRNLYLAFLLGFYDGDGTQGTTRITTGSKIFLKQIKELFKIKNKIREEQGKSIIEGRIIDSHYCVLNLGADLFNEMMDNYENSLLRKRKRFCSENDRIIKIREACQGKDLKGKLVNLSKEDLRNLVWKLPTIKIAKIYNVSDNAIAKRCKKFGIDKPPRGYWAKKYSKNKNSKNF